jgi:hypothetical protein
MSDCRGQNFLRLRLPSAGVADHPIRPDQVYGPLRNHQPPSAIRRPYLLPFIEQQREREVITIAEAGVALARIHAEYGRILLLHQRPEVAKFTQLFGANGGVVSWVKHQDRIPPSEPGQRNQIPVLIRRGKIRRKSSDSKRLRTASFVGRTPPSAPDTLVRLRSNQRPTAHISVIDTPEASAK